MQTHNVGIHLTLVKLSKSCPKRLWQFSFSLQNDKCSISLYSCKKFHMVGKLPCNVTVISLCSLNLHFSVEELMPKMVLFEYWPSKYLFF